MNDDSASSAAARQPSTDNDHHNPTGGVGDGLSQGASQSETPARKNKAGLAKKLQFMTDLMASLDMFVYAELATLYYMDCSLFRLFIRSTTQSLILSPKPAEFVLLQPTHRAHIYVLFGANVLCMLLHCLVSLPAAGEAARGYLHGGVIFDFIGQKAPASKLSLLFFDFVILAFQCFMLSIHLERERLRKVVYPDSVSILAAGTAAAAAAAAAASQNPPITAAPTTQDLDAEERGVPRDDRPTDETTNIEMQPMMRPGGSTGPEANDEGRRRLLESGATMGQSGDPLDNLRSGNAILGEFHVLRAVRNLWNVDQTAAATYPIQQLWQQAAMASERRARFQTS